MKTFEEKALELLEDLEYMSSFDGVGGIVQRKARRQSLIIQALKEQDRDTRHACAESIAFADNIEDFQAGQAIRACMNTKAG